MKKAVKSSLFITLLLLLPSLSLACDFDDDGIDDPTVYNNGNWSAITSSDGMTLNQTFGVAGTFPSPGNYIGTGLLLGFVSPIDGFWNWLLPDNSTDRINFTRSDISYQAGMDLNGDGLSDLAKFLDTCGEESKSCYQERVRVNRLINNVEGTTAFDNSSLGASLRGRGPYAFWVMTADDGESFDECFAREGKGRVKGKKTLKATKKAKRKKRKFIAKCYDALTDELVRSQQIGKIKNRPFGISRAGEAATIVTWRTVTEGTATRFKFIRADGETTKVEVQAVGEVTFGDFLGTGSDQVVIVNTTTGEATVHDPVSSATSSMTFPAGGIPVSCPMKLQGESQEGEFLRSKNICKYGLC